jgi:rhodanese-related sulfurtransferase
MSLASPHLPDPGFTDEVTPESVAAWIGLPENQRPRLIDCREEEELAVCQITGNEWFPLGTFPEEIPALTGSPERGIVVYCHHGMRSLRAAHFLRQTGFTNAFSMKGGIDAWSRVIDPNVRRY